MNAREFKDHCRKKFNFLIEHFGFHEESASIKSNPFEISFASQMTRIVVQSINYGFGIDVRLCTKENSNDYSLGDLLAIRNPNFGFAAIQSSDTGEIQKRQLEQAGQALQEYATDVLNGDFSIFSELEKRVQQRNKIN